MSMVSRFTRARSQPPSTPPAPAVADPRILEDQIAARVVPLIRQLEDDVMLTMRVIDYKAQRAKSLVAQTVGHVEEIGASSDDLAGIAAAATSATVQLTETMQRLDAATRAIERNTASADLFIAEAGRLTRDLEASTRRMNAAVETITGVVQLIATIARRTNLLALNASIEAARLGPAGRSFSVIAAEMKTLAEQARNATGDVSGQTAGLQDAARAGADTSDRIGALLARIEPVLAAVRGAVDAQIAQSGEVAAHAAKSESFVSYVARQAAMVKDTASQAVRAGRDSGEAGDDMIQSLERLTQRSMVFLRHSAHGDRRRHERVPVKLQGTFSSTETSCRAIVLDVSAKGCLARLETPPPPGLPGRLRLPGLGVVSAKIVATSELGAHICFDSVEPAFEAALNDIIAEAKARYAPLIARVRSAASDIAAAFEAAIQRGETALDEIITNNYEPIEGTSPVQYTTSAMPFYQQILPEIMDFHRNSDEQPIFLLPLDRNAFLPVHHPEFSHPQRPGDTVWNDLNARNRRLLDRWMTLIGGRNREPAHLRVYLREDKDGATTPVLVISCPVFVRSALWGNVQAAFNY